VATDEQENANVACCLHARKRRKSMLVTRGSLVVLSMMVASVVFGAAPLAAQCPTSHSIQYYSEGPMAPADTSALVIGEGMGAIFHIPPAELPVQITAVWIGTVAGDGSIPGWSGSWTAIQVWDAVNPNPTSAPTYEFLSPQVTEGQVVRNDVTTSGPPMVVRNPRPYLIVVPSFAIGGPYPGSDTDGTCTPGRNLVRWLFTPPAWLDGCGFANGDLAVRIEYRSLACPTGVPHCFGDGSGTACPCNNSGAAGHGCANSVAATGGLMTAQGGASVSADSLRLHASGMPPASSALFLQTELRNNGGLGVLHGDGLLCISGPLIRLGTRTASAGAVSFGAGVASDPAISVRGQIPPAGATRVYQVTYRNPTAYCTPASFNMTNAVEVVWAP
jgi:hypothetical protein